MTQVLVTGASGFIGRALVPALVARDHQVRALHSPRSTPPLLPAGNDTAVVEWHAHDLSSLEPLPRQTLEGVEVIVHLAGLAHVPRGSLASATDSLKRLNVLAPEALARQAAAAGVRRFVFVSSVLVHGDRSPGRPLAETSPLAPVEAYGASKAEAEEALAQASRESGLELTIVRPTLVYGPGAKGNFAKLLAWAVAGRPLPSALNGNRRSFLGLTNLCSLLALTIDHPAAGNQCFMASDGQDFSTGELYRRTALRAGSQPWFFPAPRFALASLLKLLGKAALAQRLLGNLQVTSSKATHDLGWVPPASVEEELDRAIAWQRASSG